MILTRRDFLGWGAAALLPSPAMAGRRAATPRCIVLAVPHECALPESPAGFRRALAALPAPPAREVWIVPAVLALPSWHRARVRHAARGGALVVIESGAGFAGRDQFDRHRHSIREALQLEVEAPVALWPGDQRSHVPYVDFTWPHTARIRDFSRAVLVRDPRGVVIARAGDLPVAVWRPLGGGGELIYLGTPVGPALWAGDAEAHAWFSRLLSR